VIETVRSRFDGRRRNPFDEAECGHHYARAMASWGAVPALTGFSYDGVERTMTFAASAEPTTWFWSNGTAWGTFAQRAAAGGVSVTLEVVEGTLALRELALTGVGTADLGDGTLGPDERIETVMGSS
jgi:hypothetical protein